MIRILIIIIKTKQINILLLAIEIYNSALPPTKKLSFWCTCQETNLAEQQTIKKLNMEFQTADLPGGLARKLRTRLIKLPKLFSNSLLLFACKSDHVNSVSDT